MGLFRRSRREPDPAPTGPGLSDAAPGHVPADAGPVAPGPGGGVPAYVAQRAAHADAAPAWQSVAPLSTTLSAPTSTFKIGAAVKGDLVALDSPRLSHGMGHLVGGDAPAGVVGGLATVTVQRHEDGDDSAAPSGDATTAPNPAHDPGRPVDMPVVARTGPAAGNSDGGMEPGTPDDGWGALLVPRIVPAASEVRPGWSGRPVDAQPVDAPARHLPLVTPPPAVQRHTDAEPSGLGAGGDHHGHAHGAATGLPVTGSDEGVDAAELPERGAPTAEAHGDPSDGQDGVGHDGDGVASPAGDVPAPASLQRAVDGTHDARPRPGALGPPLHTHPESDLGAGDGRTGSIVPVGHVQRRAADAGEAPPSAPGSPDPAAGPGDGASALDLAIRQRPRPGGPPTGGHEATPVVARSVIGPDRIGQVSPPAASTHGLDAGGSLPLVQRALDASRTADDEGSGPDDSDAAEWAGSDATSSSEPVTAAADPTDDEPAADAGEATGASPEPTVRPTLGRDDGTAGSGAESPGPGEGPTGTVDGPPLPLPVLQRRADDAQTEVDPSGTSVLSAAMATPGRDNPNPAPSAASVTAPPAGAPRAPTMPQPPAPVATLPLVAQRSLGPIPSLRDALATRVPGNGEGDVGDHADAGPVVTPLVTWPSPAGAARLDGTAPRRGATTPSIQRWPDLGSVTGAGRDALGAASGAARERARALAERGRQAAADRLTGAVPDLPDTSDLPDIPGAGSLPALDLAHPPQVPSVPSTADLPGIPDLASLPGAPTMPSLPGAGTAAAAATAAAGAVPMTEITFPSPAMADGGGGDVAASPAAATSGAAATGTPGGGDLDELAHKLYDRIRWRMRAELRLDRERAGLGAGVRH